jgi:hypothetical protein
MPRTTHLLAIVAAAAALTAGLWFAAKPPRGDLSGLVPTSKLQSAGVLVSAPDAKTGATKDGMSSGNAKDTKAQAATPPVKGIASQGAAYVPKE